MELASVEGVLLTLFILVPGMAGDTLMRFVTPMAQPTSDLVRSINGVAWSVAALAALELGFAWVTGDSFGAFLIRPLAAGQLADGTANLAARYLALFAVALLLPSFIRWTARRAWAERLMLGRTLAEPALDRLLNYRPDQSDEPSARSKRQPRSNRRRSCRVRVVTEKESFEGWLQWTSLGTEPDPAYIIRADDSREVTWIPISRTISITLLEDVDDSAES